MHQVKQFVDYDVYIVWHNTEQTSLSALDALTPSKMFA
jgi:hypothetical protein